MWIVDCSEKGEPMRVGSSLKIKLTYSYRSSYRCFGAARTKCKTAHQVRMFRAFADQTKSDRMALAACIRGSSAV